MLRRSIASDPAGYAYGFGRIHWSAQLGRVLVFFGNSHNPRGNNSIRAYDPAVNTWETLYANSNGAIGLQNRDNFQSLVVPRLGYAGELWVWGGSGLENWPGGGIRDGRFDLSRRAWVGAIGSACEGFGEGPTNAGCAWDAANNQGLVVAGSQEGNATRHVYRIEGATTTPYRMVRLGDLPQPYAQCSNGLVVDKRGWFWFLGTYQGQAGGQYLMVNHLWRSTDGGASWQSVPSQALGGYQPALTYDAARDCLLATNYRSIMRYDIGVGVWSNETPPDWPDVYGLAGVGTPHGHVFIGGNWAAGDAAAYQALMAVWADAPLPTTLPPLTTTPPLPTTPPPLPTTPAPVPTTPPPVVTGPRALPLPPMDQGPCAAGYGGKHLRLAYHPDTGRVYELGGDYTMTVPQGSSGSLRNELWSTDLSTPSWRLEYPYCGFPGDVMPGRPDEVGFTWDSTRKVFWTLPGFFGLSQAGPGPCGGQAEQVAGVLTFDPTTRKWTTQHIVNWPVAPGSQSPKFWTYDAVTDSLWALTTQGALADGQPSGMMALRIDCSTRQGSASWAGYPIGGVWQNGGYLGAEYAALDPVGRWLYVPSPTESRLLRFHLGERVMEYVTALPEPTIQDAGVVAWADALYYLAQQNLEGRSQLWRWDGQAWSLVVARGQLIDGVPFRASAMVALPGRLLCMGGIGAGGSNDPTVTHLFLVPTGGVIPPSLPTTQPPLTTTEAPGPMRKQIILDTDYGHDSDDAADLWLTHVLAVAEDWDLLGVVSTSSLPTSAPAIRACLDSVDRHGVPVAWCRHSPTQYGGYSAPVRDAYRPGDTGTAYPTSLDGYRAWLQAATGEVTILTTGPLTAIRELLQADPGLVTAKVAQLIIVAGLWPASTPTTGPEWNLRLDPGAAQAVLAHWPGAVTLVGIELAGLAAAGAGHPPQPPDTIASGWGRPPFPVASPWHLAWETADGQNLHDVDGHRTAWGNMGVLYAFRGLGQDFTVAGANGTAAVTGDGHSTWSATPGRHSYLGLARSRPFIQGDLLALGWPVTGLPAADFALTIRPGLTYQVNGGPILTA